MATQKKYSQEFKNDAVEYRKSHADLSLKTCAANLGGVGGIVERMAQRCR